MVVASFASPCEKITPMAISPNVAISFFGLDMAEMMTTGAPRNALTA